MSEVNVTQSRWKSKVFWSGIVSIIMLVLGQYGLYEQLGITSEFVQNLFNMIWIVVAGYSAGNDPTSATKY